MLSLWCLWCNSIFSRLAVLSNCQMSSASVLVLLIPTTNALDSHFSLGVKLQPHGYFLLIPLALP